MKRKTPVTLRSAVGKVLWRILIFYVGAIFVIVTIFPWDQIGSNGSPFVLTFAKIGITAAAGIINFVVLTAALSGCNSGMYSCGRMLYATAKNRQLPAAIGKVSRNGVPSVGVALSILILLVGSCLNYIILIRSGCSSMSIAPASCRGWCPVCDPD